jgi:hypothetical protein
MEEFGRPVRPVPLNQLLGTFVGWLFVPLILGIRQ